MDNGILQVTLSKPDGIITGVRYNGIDNLMEIINKEDNRGYWDVVWAEPGRRGIIFDTLKATEFKVILQNENQVELSFTRTWNVSQKGTVIPLNIDKRFIMLRGNSGFYTYAIYEHLRGWPDFDLEETRVAFKLRKDKFQYMAIADNRQRKMPMPDDRKAPRGQKLAYPEAVRLINPIDPNMKGEVDDKYQYSCNNEDNKVHGWICANPVIGFWQITPSDEFRTGGLVKQNLTSHVGPTMLAMFQSRHYSGDDLAPKFRNGEYWKKVFGPVFLYLNSNSTGGNDMKLLWEDAKSQMLKEVRSWPYNFPASNDFPKANQRGSVSGRLFVRDRYINGADISAKSAYIGLALPGDAGSWQRECKGYQFWTKTNADGSFSIANIRTGNYNLYAWVPGFIGDYKYNTTITINPGSAINVGNLVYEPPRDGPTLWEVGIPNRSAAEFFVPDPNPLYINKLYINHPDRFRQYGLWERYAELYPNGDLIYTVGKSDFRKDWFFAHVTRKKADNTYQATTWQIKFTLNSVTKNATYRLRLALASATHSELQVRFNDSNVKPTHFSTGLIGEDNSIARHGIHGLHWLYNIVVQSNWLVVGENTIFLTLRPKILGPFVGFMYDYIRLEGPSANSAREIEI
ncbi:hypothetical protein QJS04_geneDACA007519 [Acorus gramineus]|uniref:rhamnogalacturonan endolyase n=1 Tax=Acorus gramineus TaxID=55184 RepID=A0AAV9B5W9_ACOGR|nr:hypothetical protein QJS04_geneDACA007519 [Acorus gramineus]